MIDPFTQVMFKHFGTPTIKKPVDEKIYTKTSVIPQGDGTYRASISYFVGGNTHSVTDVKASIEEAEEFIEERLNRAHTPD